MILTKFYTDMILFIVPVILDDLDSKIRENRDSNNLLWYFRIMRTCSVNSPLICFTCCLQCFIDEPIT